MDSKKGQEPCDAISRQAALDALGKDIMGGLNYRRIIGKELPSVALSRTKGHWIIDEDRNDPDRKWDWRRFKCSACGRWQTYGMTSYCPKCGAEMEGEG